MEIYIDISEYSDNGAFGATLVIDAALVEDTEHIEAWGKIERVVTKELIVHDACLFELDHDGGESGFLRDIDYTDFISDEYLIELIEGGY